MALRHIAAAAVLAFVIGKTLRDPKFGVLAFVAVLLMDPSSLFWGFDQWRIPLITSLTLLLSTCLHFERRNRELGGGAVYFWVFMLVLFLTISTMYSVNVERSSRILIDYWIKTFIFCWLLMLWTQNEQDLRRFFSVLVACFVLLSLRAMYRYSVGYEEIAGLAGTMQDRNDFALHLMMATPIAYAMAETSKDRIAKWFFLGATMLMFVCVMLTFSRMGFLLMLTSGAMIFSLSRKKLRIVQTLVPVAFIYFVLLPDAYYERMETILTYKEDASAMGRIDAWKAGWEMGKDHPLTGVGLKCFELPDVYFRYAEGIPHVAHNAYVQLFSEAGIPALFAWLFLMLTAIFGARSLARKDVSFETRNYAKALQYSLILYLLGSIFLNAAYFELPYLVVALFVVLRRIHRVGVKETKGEPRVQGDTRGIDSALSRPATH